MISRGDFQDGYETFVRNRLDVDAVFRVSGHPRLLCEERKSRAHSPPPTIHMGFDALGVVFDNHGLWIGLEPSATGEYPPPRPYRTKHATHKSSVGELSVGSEGKGDWFGETWHHSDALELLCREPASLATMHGIGCVMHDFIILTFGCFVPARLVLYTTGGYADRRQWRRFELIAQAPRFSEHEPVKRWAPMLSLSESGGLAALAKLIRWCDDDPNSTVLHRVVHQWGDWQRAFAEHWRTLTMLYSRKESEHKRFAKLVDAVGKGVAKTIKPGDVSFDVWHRAVASCRSEVVAHPQGLESDDSRILDEGRAFTHHMEFFSKRMSWNGDLASN